MANEKKFPVQIVIGAVDEVTLKVMAINEKLKKLTEPIAKVGSSLKMLGGELGIGKLGAALGVVRDRFGSFLKDIGKAGLLVGGIAYGMFRLVKGTTDYADQIGDASQRVGISTKAFQVWNHQAAQADLTSEELEGSLIRFSKAMGEAGIKGKMEDVLPKLAKQLSKVKDETERNKILFDAFGKSGPKMAAFMDRVAKSGGNIEEAFKKLLASGDVIDPADIDKADKFNNEWALLVKKFQVLKVSVLSEFMPALMGMLRDAAKFIAENREGIVRWAQAFAKDLPGHIKTLVGLFRGFMAAIQPVVVIFDTLGKAVGHFNLVAGALIAFIAGKAILAIYALMGALVKLGVVAATTPIGWIAIGIGLVIAAIAALIIYWEPISQFFIGLWDILRESPFTWLLGPIGFFIKAADLIMKAWEPLSAFFSGIWEKIKAVASFIPGFGGGAAPATAQGPAAGGAKLSEGAVSLLGGGGASGETKLTVDFANMPRGARVKTEKADSPIDLNMGYSLAAGVP